MGTDIPWGRTGWFPGLPCVIPCDVCPEARFCAETVCACDKRSAPADDTPDVMPDADSWPVPAVDLS